MLAVSSPFGSFYQEWQETLSDVQLRQKRRFTVALSIKPREYERTAVEPPTELRIATVVDFMNANLHRKVTLAEMASLINLSASHFSYFFKTQTGVPPGEYLIKLRMEKAAKLLATTFLSVKQIVASLGYGTRSNFAPLFKKYYDASPSEYRKRAFKRI